MIAALLAYTPRYRGQLRKEHQLTRVSWSSLQRGTRACKCQRCGPEPDWLGGSSIAVAEQGAGRETADVLANAKASSRDGATSTERHGVRSFRRSQRFSQRCQLANAAAKVSPKPSTAYPGKETASGPAPDRVS